MINNVKTINYPLLIPNGDIVKNNRVDNLCARSYFHASADVALRNLRLVKDLYILANATIETDLLDYYGKTLVVRLLS